ncbi:MarR family transcriptional regulator [Rhizobium rhizosphaerae]|uniref:MarR family transcriptional regulator n=2 Tax=Xaviernesmea rhizosphaerae TaxID=1672749 RepID=A0A1Q9AJV2_9HYPH|nr:MarR family transcriptional regulator [Xaviernesmea rhizosphaerae]OQP86773.1 MarR family transcriptional regulator [Xaviernesmea rhizosphaerae]
MDADRPSEEAASAEVPVLGREEILAYYARTGYALEHHAAHLLRRAHQRATACFQAVMPSDDLTPTQMAALATLLKHGELSQNHLGRMTQMDPSTISLVVKALLKRGLIARKRSDTDQRMTMIALTNAGVEYTLPLLDLSMQVARRLLSPLSPAEQATLLDLLNRIGEPDAA